MKFKKQLFQLLALTTGFSCAASNFSGPVYLQNNSGHNADFRVIYAGTTTEYYYNQATAWQSPDLEARLQALGYIAGQGIEGQVRDPINTGTWTQVGIVGYGQDRVNLYWQYGGPPVNTNCWHVKITNNDFQGHTYGVTSNGVPLGPYYAYVPVGGNYEATICATNQLAGNTYQAVQLNSDASVEQTYNGGWTTNSSPSGVGITNSVDLATGSSYGGGTNAIPGASVGDNAIYQALSQLDSDLRNQLRSGVGITNNLSTTVNVTNNNNVTVTNSTDMSGVSNLLTQIRDNATNGASVPGLKSLTNRLIWTASGAEAAARSDMGDLVTQAQAVSDAAAAGPPSTAGAGDGSPLLISFCGGYTLNLDPADIFPGLPAIFKLVFSWTLIFGMVYWMGREYKEAVQSVGRAQTGGVPDLDIDVPLIGNALGVVVYAAVPLAYIGICLALFHYLFGMDFNLTGRLGYLHSTNPFSTIASGSSGYTALYLLNEFIDLDLVLALAWVRFSWYFVGTNLLFIAQFAMRYLPGK